jgi:outer membrane protein
MASSKVDVLRMSRSIALVAAALLALLIMGGPAEAQQRLGYVDSDFILERIPEYQTAQQELDRLAQQWQSQLADLKTEIEELEQDFIARELLYTDEERTRRRAAITDRRREHDNLRTRYFGPDGELFREQTRLLRPVQERVLEAIEIVARDGNYDYVFDKSGDFLFLYARTQHDLSDRVLEELGIDTAGRAGR